LTASVTPTSIAIFSHGEIIGDALYKVPFVRAVRGAFPQARLAWVTTLPSMLESRLGPLMAGFVDEFRTGCGLGTSPLELLRPCPIREHYDIVIDTQSMVWRTLLARRIRHGVFVSPAAGFRLSERRPPPGYVKPPHMVDRLLDLMELAGGVRPARLPRLTIPADLAAVAARQLPDGRDYIALAPGAGKRVKCWPLDRFVAVARAQAERGRVPLFVLGPHEQEW
jgi:ADP-heptose:LPS heptosyltransferase